MVSQCVRAYWNRSVHQPIHRLGRNGFLLGACVAAVAIQALIPYVPPLAEAFRATPLDAADWLLVALIAFAPAVVAEVVALARARPGGLGRLSRRQAPESPRSDAGPKDPPGDDSRGWPAAVPAGRIDWGAVGGPAPARRAMRPTSADPTDREARR